MLGVTRKAKEEKTATAGRLLGLVLLAAIMALALGLRVWGLWGESVWWDEYTSVMHLDAPDLWSFLALNRTLDPATLPLYYSLEYLWWHGISDSIAGLRLLSVLLGLLTVPLLFLIGRELFGNTAGLIAALCFAVSPIHTFHAQGIRMYVLLTLLAAVSAYTFIHILRGGTGRWWAAHAAGNLLLLWTHPFAALLLAAEGLLLIAFRMRRLRQTACWFVLQLILVLPSAVYLSQVRFWPRGQTSTWLRIPGPLEFLGDLLADDVVSMTYQLRISEAAWTDVPVLLAMRPWLDAAFVVLAVVCLGWLGWRAFGRPLRSRKDTENGVFLLLWLLLPATALYAASLLWRPCLFPRYTLHCSLALYLIVGGAIAGRRARIARGGAVAVLLVLLGYQVSLVHPGPQRTDWQSAARLIRTEGQAGDLILVQDPVWRDVFLFNMGSTLAPVASAKTSSVLAQEAAFFLRHADRPDVSPGTQPGGWVVFKLPYFDSGPNREFEAEAVSQGLQYTLTELPGIEHLLVYHVLRASGAAAPAPSAQKDVRDYVEGYGDLAMTLAAAGDYETAAKALNAALVAEPAAGRIYGPLLEAIERRADVKAGAEAVRALLKGHGYRENGEDAFAAAEFRKAAALAPMYATAHVELGLMLARLEDYPGAQQAFEKAFELEPAYASVYAGPFQAVRHGSNVTGALAAVELRTKGNELETAGRLAEAIAAYRKAVEADPHYSPAFANLGVALARDEKTGQALEALRRAVALDVGLDGVYGRVIRALESGEDAGRMLQAVFARARGNEAIESGLTDAGIAELRSATALDPGFAAAYAELGMALARAGDTPAAVEALREAIALDPACLSVYESLAEALERRSGIDSALAAAHALVEGFGLEAAGDMDAAVRSFWRATAADPDCTGAWHALGRALLEMGDFSGALPVLRVIAGRSPSDRFLYAHLIDVIAGGGDVGKAFQAFKMLFDGIGRNERGDTAGATEVFENAARLDPGFALPHVALGFKYLEAGDRESAMQELRKAIEIDRVLVGPWEGLLVYLLEANDLAAARREAATLQERGVFLPPELVAMIERVPESPQPASGGEATGPASSAPRAETPPREDPT